jgi:hypothetical protein
MNIRCFISQKNSLRLKKYISLNKYGIVYRILIKERDVKEKPSFFETHLRIIKIQGSYFYVGNIYLILGFCHLNKALNDTNQPDAVYAKKLLLLQIKAQLSKTTVQ